MKKVAKTIILSVILTAALWAIVLWLTDNRRITKPTINSEPITVAENQAPEIPVATSSPLIPPLDLAPERVTKKPFGLYVARGNSPIKPERFSGYHAGVDFEILPGEENADVTVTAVCDGALLMKKFATGYGGVAVASRELNSQAITVVYGHLKLASIALNAGDKITAGQTIGFLGQGNSPETDGERKHLHLGIHKGVPINLLGYVAGESQLVDWLNILDYIK